MTVSVRSGAIESRHADSKRSAKPPKVAKRDGKRSGVPGVGNFMTAFLREVDTTTA